MTPAVPESKPPPSRSWKGGGFVNEPYRPYSSRPCMCEGGWVASTAEKLSRIR